MKIHRTKLCSLLQNSVAFAALGFVPTVVDAQALREAADVRNENAVAETAAVDANVRSSAYAAYVRHEYALQSDGNLKGKVRMVEAGGALTPTRVKLFFVRHGEVVSQATPNAEGTFQATGLTPGYYSVIADGPSGIGASGVRVVPAPEKAETPKAHSIGRQKFVANSKADADAKKAAEAPGADTMFVTLIPTIDVAVADRLDELQNGPRVGAAPRRAEPAEATIRTVAATAADSVVAAAESSTLGAVSVSADMMADAYERSAYYLGADGKLSGQLTHFDNADKLVASPFTPIFFLQQGRVVARATTNGQGYYDVAGLVPGTYSFVVAGNDQFGATGIQIYPAPAELVPATKIKSVSFNRAMLQPGGGGPNAGGGRSGDNQAARGGGGFGGGGGGAGGGGGGGVGGGGGGGLGGLGALGAALGAGIGAGAAGGGGNGGSGTSSGNNPGSP